MITHTLLTISNPETDLSLLIISLVLMLLACIGGIVLGFHLKEILNRKKLDNISDQQIRDLLKAIELEDSAREAISVISDGRENTKQGQEALHKVLISLDSSKPHK